MGVQVHTHLLSCRYIDTQAPVPHTICTHTGTCPTHSMHAHRYPSFIQVCRYIGVQAHQCTGTLTHIPHRVCTHTQAPILYTGVQAHRYAGTQVCRYTGVQVHKCAGTWVCRYTGTHPPHSMHAHILYMVCRYTGVQAHTYPFPTPVCRHTGTHSPQMGTQTPSPYI